MSKNNSILFDYENKKMQIYHGDFLITVIKTDDGFQANWEIQETGEFYRVEKRTNLDSICHWLDFSITGGWDSASVKPMLKMGTDFLFFMKYGEL